MPRHSTILLAALILISAATALAYRKGSEPSSRAPRATDPVDKPAERGGDALPPREAEASDYARQRVDLEARGEVLAKRAAAQPGSWMPLERLAEVHLALARLTGRYEGYGAAEEALARAFERAPEGAGPWLTRARLHLTLHRLDEAEADLEAASPRVLTDDLRESRIHGLRGDLAFARGRFDEASRHYQAAWSLHRTLDHAFRQATHDWKSGDFDRAEAWLDEAEKLPGAKEGRVGARLALQRGLMDLDRGRTPEALAHYREAGRRFSGWWLVEEHIAEIDALEGRTSRAIASYRELVERTKNPELMGALAALLEAEGDPAAPALLARARSIHERRIARFPAAAAGHALEFFLEWGGDPAQVVELAEANHARRPDGEAKTLLALAYVRAGRPREARRAVEEALATPYRRADLHALAALLFEAAGVETQATRERTRALEMHPGALDDLAWVRPHLGIHRDAQDH